MILLCINDCSPYRSFLLFSEAHGWLKSLFSQDPEILCNIFYGIPTKKGKRTDIAESKAAG